MLSVHKLITFTCIDTGDRTLKAPSHQALAF